MFSVMCKDPLEAEKVGERRSRKANTSGRCSTPSDGSNSSRPASAMPADTLFALRRDKPVVVPIPSPSSPPSTRTTSTPLTSPDIYSNTLTGTHRGDSYFDLNPWGANAKPVSRANNTQSVEETGHDPSQRYAPKHKNLLRKMGMSPKPASYPAAPPSQSSFDSPSLACDNHSTRTSTFPQQESMIRFHRLLRKIEMANDNVATSRLATEWDGGDEDMEAEFYFETALWALVGMEKLRIHSQLPVEVPKDEHELSGLYDIRAGMHVLCLGPVHDSPMSWYLGARHPATTFHSLGVREQALDLPSSSWGVPPNVKTQLWPEPPRLSLLDDSYDMVIVHDLFHVVRCTDWTILITEIARVLAPGGVLAMSLIDPLPQRSGPLLEAWTKRNLEIKLAQKFMVPQPSLMVPFWIDEAAQFSQPQVESVEFPCYTPLRACKGRSPTPAHTNQRHRYSTPLDEIQEHPTFQSGATLIELDFLIGKQLHQTIYEDCLPTKKASYLSLGTQFIPNPRRWWWDDQEVMDECQQFDTAFRVLTFFYRKI